MKTWKEKFFEDKEMMKIFQAIMDSPKSAQQISRECGIPIDTVRKKLKELREKNLLEASKSIYDYNEKNHLFRKLNEAKYIPRSPKSFHCYQ